MKFQYHKKRSVLDRLCSELYAMVEGNKRLERSYQGSAMGSDRLQERMVVNWKSLRELNEDELQKKYD